MMESGNGRELRCVEMDVMDVIVSYFSDNLMRWNGHDLTLFLHLLHDVRARRYELAHFDQYQI